MIKLGIVTERVLQVLQDSLTNCEDVLCIRDTMIVLSKCGDRSARAIPQLQLLLQNPSLRADAALAIYKISGRIDVVQVLIEDCERERWPGHDLPPVGLTHRSITRKSLLHDLKLEAVRALAEIGPSANSALPTLRRLSHSPNYELRAAALRAYRVISGRVPLRRAQN